MVVEMIRRRSFLSIQTPAPTHRGLSQVRGELLSGSYFPIDDDKVSESLPPKSFRKDSVEALNMAILLWSVRMGENFCDRSFRRSFSFIKRYTFL